MRKYQVFFNVFFVFIFCLFGYNGHSLPGEPLGNRFADKQVTGNVTSDDGKPLSGVNIIVKGTTTGTTSDANGNFTIRMADKGGVLVFSSIGFTQKEVKVGSEKTITVIMSTLNKQLDEVVVIGYGTTRKSDLTGSVASIKSEDLKKTQVTTFDQALQGRAAGVQVTQLSGKPGAETSIRIRGTSSINAGNEP
ncbi:MAG: carboxypeptidase-like regulatory domain-containing protein, partial [Ginsengibacter sp.]